MESRINLEAAVEGSGWTTLTKWEVQVSGPLQPAFVEMAKKLCVGLQAACRVNLLARDDDEHKTNDDKILTKWAQQKEQEENAKVRVYTDVVWLVHGQKVVLVGEYCFVPVS